MMLRIIVGLALILPVHGQEKSAHSTGDKRGTDAKANSPAPSGPSTVNVINQQAPNQQTNGAESHPKSYLCRLFSPENLPNVGLFIVGCAGIIIAICTLGKIRNQAELMNRQAKIMERQAKLQEAQMQQWIDYVNWKCRYQAGGFTGHRLRVQFEIVNSTNLPLTIPSGYVVFGPEGPGPTTFYLRDDCKLNPRRPHVIWSFFPLTEDQAQLFTNGGQLPFRVNGELDHIGALGRRQPQSFLGTLWTSQNPNATYFEEETPQQPQGEHPEGQADGQNPN
jgi:hypothetical protein